MPWGAVVGAAVSYYGSKKASEAAADASEAATSASVGEQRRQFDLAREDTAVARARGDEALNRLYGDIREGQYTPGEFAYSGDIPGGEPLPEFGARNRFAFDLEADPGYQFAKEQAIKETNRQAAQGGKYGSGNRLAEIADRVTGVASQYANQAFQRQLQGSRENYGRGLSEYGLDYGRAQDMYGRDVAREGAQYNRALTDYGIGEQRQQNMYGQNQDYLNRLAAISRIGQTATGQSIGSGQSAANAIGNLNMFNAQQQANAANTRYQGGSNAINAGITNYLQYQRQQDQNQQQDDDAWMYNV